MLPHPKAKTKKQPISKKIRAASTDDLLHHQAFDNSLQANIIFTVTSGKVVLINDAACKLLGYSKKELLAKNRSAIFDVTESSFKKMMKQRRIRGHSIAYVTAIKKTGKRLPCEITSAVFIDEYGIQKSITTIVDMSQSILNQKNIDDRKEKIVADNIVIAKSKQKEIDIKKDKIVADNIVLAKSKQKSIDVKKEKIVADNIVLAQSKQNTIDVKKEKVVADNIVLAQSKQNTIDVKKEKVVADNIVLAQSKQKVIDTRNEKIVADNIVLAQSKQKVIDTKNEKIVADNIVLAKSKQKVIDTKNEKIVADNIVLAQSKQKRIDTRNEKTVADNIVLAKSKQRTIDALKEKIVADNIILAQAKSDAKLAENNDWLKDIGKTSYDVMWDWDIATGEIYVSESIEEVFGYKVSNNTVSFTDFSRCLVPEEKEAIEKKLLKTIASNDKSWNDSYSFMRSDGSVARATSRASIVRDEEGKALRLIGAMQDVTTQQELEKKLEAQISITGEDSERFLLAAKHSFDVLWDWNILTNELLIGEGFEELFGYVIKNNKGVIADWNNHIHPLDKEAVEKGLLDAIASSATYWEHAYRFTRADGSIAKIFNRGSFLRHPDGKAYRMIGAMQDLSKQQILEERLEQEIRLKENQIAEAIQDARDSERSDIGKELHDNVNQLLSVSKMYLEMAKQGGDKTKMYLSRSSQYTLSAIEEMRKLTKGLTSDTIKNLGLCEAIEILSNDTMEVNPVKISCDLASFQEASVNNKFKLNVFRIVQEQLGNVLKHAKATNVRISLSQHKESISLSISDNGVGFDTEKKRIGIGIDNIKSRSASYNGIADFVSQPGKGCVLTVTFPVTEALSMKN